MSKGHMSNDDFFLRLSELFDERRKNNHGSIFLIQKRMNYGSAEDGAEPTAAQLFPDHTPTDPLPILIRATNGKSKANRDQKIKISTIVEADALEGFFAKYAEVCKSGMSGLKPRDRSKAKEKLKAKKKKQGGASELKKA